MTELMKWDTFYVIVGSAAGALIGLQFVVITLISERPHESVADAGAAFGSPTIVHFSSALFLALLFHAPWQSMRAVSIVWALLGISGVVYIAIVVRLMLRQNAYKPVLEDWMFHVVLPLAAYGMLAVSAFAASSHTREGLFSVGGASLLLLFIGIHNAWDNVAYHVLVARPRASAERDREEAKKREQREI